MSRNSANSSRPHTPREYDILCGKDKTYAKHGGNRIFRERIDAMKVPYCEAPNKQEKMEITKEIVTFMQNEYGSRFLKMEGDVWVEIPNQAARDKVSHALRFAARNYKSTNAAANGDNKPKRRPRTSRKRRASSDESCSGSSNSTTSSPTDSDKTENDDDDAIPLTQVFGTNVALNVAAACPPQQRQSTAFSTLPDYTDFSSQQFSTPPADFPTPTDIIFPNDASEVHNTPHHQHFAFDTTTHNTPATLDQQRQEDAFVTMTRRSFGSMQLGDEIDAANAAPGAEEPAFNTLRSADLNEIMNEPLDVDEWEVVARIAEC